MHEFWIISTVNMTYTRSQNYTNMMVGEHGMQTFEIMVVVIFLMFLSPQVHIPIIFGQVACPNILKCKLCMVPNYLST